MFFIDNVEINNTSLFPPLVLHYGKSAEVYAPTPVETLLRVYL